MDSFSPQYELREIARSPCGGFTALLQRLCRTSVGNFPQLELWPKTIHGVRPKTIHGVFRVEFTSPTHPTLIGRNLISGNFKVLARVVVMKFNCEPLSKSAWQKCSFLWPSKTLIEAVAKRTVLVELTCTQALAVPDLSFELPESMFCTFLSVPELCGRCKRVLCFWWHLWHNERGQSLAKCWVVLKVVGQ